MCGSTPPWLMTALCSNRDSSASPLMASCRCLQGQPQQGLEFRVELSGFWAGVHGF
jgi:hypothetical protein